MIRAALEGFGTSLKATDAIVAKAAGNTMALVHRYSPFVARGVIAHPLQEGGAPCPRTKRPPGRMGGRIIPARGLDYVAITPAFGRGHRFGERP
jgi:hypothetical protein